VKTRTAAADVVVDDKDEGEGDKRKRSGCTTCIMNAFCSANGLGGDNVPDPTSAAARAASAARINATARGLIPHLAGGLADLPGLAQTPDLAQIHWPHC
jgi:hypothetical protein